MRARRILTVATVATSIGAVGYAVGAQAEPQVATVAAASVASPDPAKASRIEKTLRASLGARFGGAWVSGGKVVVATTDARTAARVRQAGAEPTTVRKSARQLTGVHKALDRRAPQAPDEVTSWYVDVKANTVVVEATSPAAAERFVAASGADESAVRIVRTAQRPTLRYDIIGGERYWTSQYGCSIGFAIDGGYLTAGHCGKVGEATRNVENVAQGAFGGSSFPGDDYAWVDTNGDWVPTPRVNRWDGTYETVYGAEEAPVGTPVCRSGSTTSTQLWCGTILERNASVNYPEGVVTGMIRTDICSNSGDSGGALITQTGGQAQGLTSGGSGSCPAGGITYFQPVTEVLDILRTQYGRDLVVAESPG